MNLAITRGNPSTRNRAVQVAKGCGLLGVMLLGLGAALPSFAFDLAALQQSGPLSSALTSLNGLNDGMKALIGFVGFIVALVSLASLRNMGPVLFFFGLAVFGAVGLTVAGSIMGAGVGSLAVIGAL